MKRKNTTDVLIFGFLFASFLVCGHALALLQKSQDEKIWSGYVDTRSDFEKNVHDLVATKWPANKALSEEHLKLELSRLDQKTAQFNYLNKNYPQRIDRKKGIDDFVAFDWSDKDQQTLSQADPKYSEKARAIARMEHQLESRRGYNEFQDHLRSVKSSVEYKSLETRFKDMMSRVEVAFQEFKRDIKN